MKDVDGRVIQVHALYHKNFSTPDQKPHASQDPFYWNFLPIDMISLPINEEGTEELKPTHLRIEIA